jgi:hypothetical protein
VFSSRPLRPANSVVQFRYSGGRMTDRKIDAKKTIAQSRATIESSGEKASTGAITVVVDALRLYDPDTLRFVAEISVSPGDLVISGETRGYRAADGRIVGTTAGFVTTKLNGAAQEQAFKIDGWTSGFVSHGKGNPGTRDRDIALAMAVGFEERNRRLAGKPMVLTAIFELLSSDRNWRLLDADSFGKAYFRGQKLLKTACFTVVARTPQTDDDATPVGAVALVKERSSFTFESEANWTYFGFPWLWRRGKYTIEQTDQVCPLKLTTVNGECTYDKSGIKVKDS